MVARVFRSGDRSAADRRELVEFLYPVVVQQRQEANTLALQFMRAQRAQQGVVGEPIHAAVRPYRKRDLQRAVNKAARRVDVFEQELEKSVSSHVEDAARRTVIDSIRAEQVHVEVGGDLAEDDPQVIVDGDDFAEPEPFVRTDESYASGATVTETDPLKPRQVRVDAPDRSEAEKKADRLQQFDSDFEAELAGYDAPLWARVLTGADNCHFCVWLASRGAVYSSKDNALDGVKQDRFHPDCDCMAVPVWDVKNWEGNRMARYLYVWANDAEKRETERREELGLPMPPKDYGMNLVRTQMRHGNLPEIERIRAPRAA